MKNIIRGTFVSLVLMTSCANGNFKMSRELSESSNFERIKRDEIVNLCLSSNYIADSDNGFQLLVWNATSDQNAQSDLKEDAIPLDPNTLNAELELLSKVSFEGDNLLLIRTSEDKAIWIKY